MKGNKFMKKNKNIPLNLREQMNSRIGLICSVILLLLLVAGLRQLDYNLIEKPKEEAAKVAQKEAEAAKKAAEESEVSTASVIAVGDNLYHGSLIESGENDSGTWNYDQIYASVGAFSKDLMKLQKYLYDLTEVKSYIYRFPGGSSNHCAGDIKPYIRYVNQKGILYFDWNALNADAEGPRKNAQQLADYAIKTAQGKEMVVMLMHDTYGKEETVKALPTIIKYFKDNGYEFRTLA